MTDDVQDQPEVAALVAATRAWSDAVNAVVGDARATEWLRSLLRRGSHAALAVLAVRPLRQKPDLLPELVLNLDGPLTTAVLAADVIRTFPRRELAARLPFAVEEVVGGFTYEGFDQLTGLLVELADRGSLDLVLAAAARHDDPDVRELAADLDAVHLDPARWGLARTEQGGPARSTRYTVRLVLGPDARAVEHTVVTRLGEHTAVALAARREGDGDLVTAHVVRAEPAPYT